MKIKELKLGQKINLVRRHIYNNGYADSDRIYVKTITKLPEQTEHTIVGEIDNKSCQFVLSSNGYITYIYIGKKAKYEIVD